MIQDSAFKLSSSGRDDFLSLPFFSGGRPLTVNSNRGEELGIVHPRCHLTTSLAGSMRFRWNEENPRRHQFIQNNILSKTSSKVVVPVELIHSQVVFALDQDDHSSDSSVKLLGKAGSHPEEVDLRRGDGLITNCKALVPTVTVADCLPIYLYDPKTGCKGVVHSGWKGTGIIIQALHLAQKIYGAKIENFSIVIGPHIQSCCYQVEQERVDYFTSSFGKSCIQPPNSLSLAQANLNLLKEAGVKEENILCCTDCTCCDPSLGSFRRETADLGDIPLEEKLLQFTTMMAFVL